MCSLKDPLISYTSGTGSHQLSLSCHLWNPAPGDSCLIFLLPICTWNMLMCLGRHYSKCHASAWPVRVGRLSPSRSFCLYKVCMQSGSPQLLLWLLRNIVTVKKEWRAGFLPPPLPASASLPGSPGRLWNNLK